MVAASDVTFTPTGNVSSTNVQDAIAELDNEKAPIDSRITFDTRTAAVAATVPSAINILQTLGYSSINDNGGASYVRYGTSAPSHPGYITTNGGTVYWELERTQELTPEMFGAVGGDVTDCTSAFQNFALTMNAFVSVSVRFKPGVTYAVWPNDTSASANPFLLNLSGLRGFFIDFNGSSLHAKFTGSYGVNAVLMSDCSSGVITGPKGTQDRAKTDTAGVNWVAFTNGCNSVEVIGGDYNGGLQGFVCVRTIGSATARCSRIRVTQKCKDVYYPVSLQSDGDFVEFRSENENAGRDYIGYNHVGVRGYIKSKNPTNDSCLINAYGHGSDINYTRDVHITYVNLDSTSFPANAGIAAHQQADNTGSYPSYIENVTIEYDVKTNNAGTTALLGNLFTHTAYTWPSPTKGNWAPSTSYAVNDTVIDGAVDTSTGRPWQCLVAHTSGTGSFAADRAAHPTYWTRANQVLGQPAAGHKFDITLRGRLDGDVQTAGNFMTLGVAGYGWVVGSSYDGQYNVGPFRAPLCTQRLQIGQGVRVLGQHIYAPYSALTWEGTPNELRARFVASTFSTGSFDPNGNPANSATSVVSRNGHALSLYAPANNGLNLLAASDGSAVGDIVYDGGSVYYRAYNSRGQTWLTGGSYRVTLDTSGNLKPYSASSGQTLGSSANRWGTIYGDTGNVTSLLVGGANTSGINAALSVSYAGGGTQYGMVMKPASDATAAMSFVNSSNVGVGSITVSSTGTSFNTSSDYRLKENVDDLAGATERVRATPVRQFNFISEPDVICHGYIAHEAAEHFPRAVTGEKDAVKDDGSPDYQGIDMSRIVPDLHASLKEAWDCIDATQGLIDALEARISALGG